MKKISTTILIIAAFLACRPATEDNSNAFSDGFPYGNVPRKKPHVPLSSAMQRVYDGSYQGLELASNELFSRFKYMYCLNCFANKFTAVVFPTCLAPLRINGFRSIFSLQLDNFFKISLSNFPNLQQSH